ncbi:MAG: hypothetical protein ABIW83_04925 [Allosphingosinicella sp.]
MWTKLTIVSWLLLLALAGCDQMPMPADNAMDQSALPAGEPGEGVYCPAVEQRVSPADCEDLTRADSEVRPGSAAFNVPDPMRRGETFEVHLVIDRRSPKEIRIIEEPLPDNPREIGNTNDGDPDAGNASVTNSASPEDGPSENMASAGHEHAAPTPGQIVEPLPGSAERFSPPVARHMRAELIGQGFEIAAETDASQQIPLGGSAEWQWKVTARKGGAQPLTLVTVVEGVADGRRFVLARTAKVRTVTVEVSLRDKIWDGLAEAPGWIKAFTAILVALGGLLTAWYALPWWRRRGTAKDNKPADGTGGSDGGKE